MMLPQAQKERVIQSAGQRKPCGCMRSYSFLHSLRSKKPKGGCWGLVAVNFPAQREEREWGANRSTVKPCLTEIYRNCRYVHAAPCKAIALCRRTPLPLTLRGDGFLIQSSKERSFSTERVPWELHQLLSLPPEKTYVLCVVSLTSMAANSCLHCLCFIDGECMCWDSRHNNN